MRGMTAYEVHDEEPEVTHVEAMREVYRFAKDGLMDAAWLWQQFIEDNGDRFSYNGSEVIGWLGY